MPTPPTETNFSLRPSWQSKGPSLSLWGMGIVGMAVLGTIDPALAASLTHWHYDPTTNQLELTVRDGTTPRYFVMAQPARIVVDLPDTELQAGEAVKTYAGAIQTIRVSQFKPGMTRIVMQLSPDASLKPGQVKLQKAGGSQASDRWVVRPLVVNPVAARPAPTPRPAAEPFPLPPTMAKPSVIPPPVATVQPLQPTIAEPPISPPPALQPAQSQSALPDTPADAGMVVDTAGAIPIKVPVPEVTPATPSVAVPPLAALGLPSSTPLPPSVTPSVSPSAVSPSAIMPQTVMPQVVAPPDRVPPTPAAVLQPADTLPEIPTTIAATPPSGKPLITVPALSTPITGAVAPSQSSPFPPASVTPVIPSSNPPSAVVVPDAGSVPALPPINTGNVPPLVNSAASLQSDDPLSVGLPPSVYPPAIAVPPLTSPAPAPVVVPPTQPMPASSVIIPPGQPLSPPVTPVRPATPQVVEFGQPLPTAPIAPAQSFAPGIPGSPALSYRSLPPDVLLPAGSTIALRYPGATPLRLDSGTARQEVLLLQTELRDSQGNLVAPEGTPIVGRFETSAAGSRFVAQAITVQGRSLPLPAQSENLAGNRQMANNALIRNTGIGLVAGGLLGGLAGSAGAGVVGGAAAGAAATFLTAPKPATILPGQVLQVRLVQDLRL